MLAKWTEYAEHLDDCDDYVRQNVAPWVNQLLQQPPPEEYSDAQAQVAHAKVTRPHGINVMSNHKGLVIQLSNLRVQTCWGTITLKLLVNHAQRNCFG